MTLSTSFVSAADRNPEAWVLFLHGILGTGANWRSFARHLVERCPRWGAVLVDLRAHGGSRDFRPPHTLAAAAADLDALTPPGPVRALVGHSFGGKVALRYFAEHASSLEHVWVVDSTPGPRPDARGSEFTLRVLGALTQHAGPFASRREFLDAMAAAGFSDDIAQWLAVNVTRAADGFRLRTDLTAVRALLDDYFASDLWPLVESPPGRAKVDLVVGGRSTVFDDDDLARARRAAAANRGRVAVTVLPNAGHWVHIDDAQGLLEIISAGLGP